MTQLTQDLARAESVRRLDEAQRLQRGHRLQQARRLRNQAEDAVLQARLALARLI